MHVTIIEFNSLKNSSSSTSTIRVHLADKIPVKDKLQGTSQRSSPWHKFLYFECSSFSRLYSYAKQTNWLKNAHTHDLFVFSVFALNEFHMCTKRIQGITATLCKRKKNYIFLAKVSNWTCDGCNMLVFVCFLRIFPLSFQAWRAYLQSFTACFL